MRDEIECPYCGKDFEVNTDDGNHYNDGESESDYCPHCEKRIMIYSSCSWYSEASKADCLNSISEHDWSKWNKHYPLENYTKWLATRNCGICDKREQASIDVEDTDDDRKRIEMYRKVDAGF